MFIQSKYIFLVVLVVVSVVSYAQQDTSLTREVEVTKAFKPTISDANKINEMPKADEAQHTPPKFNYSIDSRPIFNTFSVNPLKAATIQHRQRKETGYGLVRAGVGNYNKPYAEFFFNNLLSRNSVFGIHAKHISSYGDVTLEGGDKVDAPYSKNEAEIYYKYNFSKTVLSIDADFNHDGFNYYGYPVKAIPEILLEEDQDITYQGTNQAFTKGGMNIKFNNPSADLDDPVFNFNMKYHYFMTKTEQKEHFGEFKVDFQKPLNTGSIIADLGATFTQADGIYNTTLMEDGKRQQTWVFLKPAYRYAGDMGDVSVGFNSWFVMDNDEDALVTITPSVKVNFVPVEGVIKIFAGIDGNYINNHYSKIAYENPFVNPMHDVQNSFEKMRFYGGFDGKLSSKTNFKMSAEYSMVDDQVFYYMNEYYYPAPVAGPSPLIIDNAFDVLYDDVNLLKLNLEIFHSSSEKLDLLLSGNYYAYNLNEQDEAWNMPGWDANLSIDYKITEQLSVGTDIYLIGTRKALIKQYNEFLDFPVNPISEPTIKIYNLDTTFDLNVNANYQITQNFAVFGQLNNFGFQKYQRWFGYPVQSFNALAGISYAF